MRNSLTDQTGGVCMPCRIGGKVLGFVQFFAALLNPYIHVMRKVVEFPAFLYCSGRTVVQERKDMLFSCAQYRYYI